jgi:serine/threonine protein kinase
MYRWCSRCGAKVGKQPLGRILCACGQETEVELEKGDTLRIDARRSFRIVRQLSQHTDAGMSAVYLAERSDKPGKRAALKVAKARRLQALKREVYHLQRLKHPNIIRLAYGKDQADPEAAILVDDIDNERLCYIALEYLDGGSLKDYIKAKGPLSLAEALRIVAAIGKALDYAHSQNIVHLDVKPPNILLGTDGRIVLSDFGVTREQSALQQSVHRKIGTLVYNAPEQLRGGATLDHRVDIYALGLVLYEMLAGRNPLYQRTTPGTRPSQPGIDRIGSTEEMLKRVILDGKVPSPREIAKDIPGDVEQVIQTAMALDPAARYGSAADMVAALERAVRRSERAGNLTLYAIVGGGLVALAVAALLILSLWQESGGISAEVATPLAEMHTATPPVLPAWASPEPGEPMLTATGLFAPEPGDIATARPTVTPEPTANLAPTATGTPTVTARPTEATPTPTPTPTPSPSPVPSPTSTTTPTPSETPLPTATPRPTSTLAVFPSPTLAPPTATRPPATPLSSATPTPAQLSESDAARLVPLTPGNGQAVGIGSVDFTWRWGEGCDPLPDGLFFEVRIWPDMPGASRLGAMDARRSQSEIDCDPGTGIRRFAIADVRRTPGALQAKEGTLRWDVAVVALNPYRVVIASRSSVRFSVTWSE